MNRNLLILHAAPLAALLALSACGEPETITAGADDPQATSLQKAGPVELPPMIQASRTYRCKDNSLIFVEFYTNDKAHVRTEREGAPTILAAAEGKPPYSGDGWSVSANAPEVNIARPGKGPQDCKA